MRYRLVHLTGALAGRVQDLDGEAVLGRDPAAAQVVFPASERLVSRRHAAIQEDEDGALVIRDLDSRAGTFLDGEDVEEAELRDGDVVELGRGGPRVRVELAETGTLVVREPPQPGPVLFPAARTRRPWPGPGTRLRLAFLSGAREGESLELAGGVIRIGRSPESAVSTPADRVVSAQHAKLVRLDEGYVLLDLESTNGTFLNGSRVERAPVGDGDVIELGPGGPQIRIELLAPGAADRDAQATVVIPNFAELAAGGRGRLLVRELPLTGQALVLGRTSPADVVLDSPIVSRRHARLTPGEGGLVLEDLGSANGTYLEGRRVTSTPVAPGERIVVGPYEIEVMLDRIRVLDTRNRLRLDAQDLGVRVEGRSLLERVSLSLPPGSFTAIIGPSGAGKSTLLGALSGARPAQEGRVLLNGTDLYAAFASLKATLGYVPQEDIVHRELTVAESLDYTARLRLPEDTSAEERARRVDAVLATLELTERRDTRIGRLSGGQRKRVSIAAELVTEPRLLFLDEPTSGLDPGLEEALMLLLRELSYKGTSVVLVTHTLDHIHLCDAVALLVDGRLVFLGPPAEARAHFGIDHMVALYGRLKERSAVDWEARYRESAAGEREARAIEAAPAEPSRARAAEPRPLGGAGAPLQLGLLSRRYLTTLLRDGRNAALLLAQAPLIAALVGLSLLYGQSDIAYTKPKNTLLFLLALTAVWFGCSNAARELVKERAIYLRERMVNLRVVPYVASKVVVLLALALVQCVAFLAILHLWFGIPGSPPLLLLAMLLASLVGIVMGLALSALSRTADRAMTLLPILLIPQVLFTSPAVQMDMKGPAGLVARVMPTWWSYDLLRRVAIAPVAALDDDTVEKRLQAGGPVLLTKERFASMLREGYPMFNYRDAIEVTWTASFPEALASRLPARLGRWRGAVADTLTLGAFVLALFAAAALLQRRLDRRRN